MLSDVFPGNSYSGYSQCSICGVLGKDRGTCQCGLSPCYNCYEEVENTFCKNTLCPTVIINHLNVMTQNAQKILEITMMADVETVVNMVIQLPVIIVFIKLIPIKQQCVMCWMNILN